MKKVKHLFSGMLAVLAVLLLTGCWEKDNPVRTSLDIDTSTLTLSVGESAVRMAFSKAEDAVITYTSSNPTVATVDQFGKVTALTEGETTITIDMAETKKSWYAAKTIAYQVVVKNVSAAALADVDKSTPLTLVAAEDGKITVTFNNGITLANDIKYTINNGAEQTIAKNTTGSFDIAVKKGDVVQFYSLNTSLGGGAVAAARGMTRAVDDGAKYINIRPSMRTEIYGNVMSLLKGKNGLESADAIEANNAFYGLFAGADKLVNSSERQIVLPATTLKSGCYSEMFSGCAGLKTAPELPAPTLTENCYAGMFSGCKKLEAVKILADNVAASGALKDFLTGAGTESEKTPVIEVNAALPEGTIPSNFTEAKAVTGIELDADEMTLTVGDAGSLKATLTPAEATNKALEWTSSNPAVATVLGDASDNTKATVTAVGAGSATITCFTPDGSVKATCAVTVPAPQEETAEMYYRYYETAAWHTQDLAEGSYAIMTSSMSTIGGDGNPEFYVVVGDITINGHLTVDNYAALVLCDGAKLTITDGISGSIAIYGQNNDTGQLIVQTNGTHYTAINAGAGSVSIFGGKISATGKPDPNTEETGDGISASFLTIYGGEVKAKTTSADEGINAGNISFIGGTIEAENGGGGNATIQGEYITIAATISSLTITNPTPVGNALTNWICADPSLYLGSSVADVTDVRSSWNAVEITSGNSWGAAVTFGFKVTRNDNTLVLTKAN